MNEIRSLTNPDLLNETLRLAGDERKITLEVLNHLREIERRKAYSDLGIKSLFDYAVTHLRYSEGSASRRIAATHALREHPELGPQIANGQTTVTSVARIHTTIRRDEKLNEKRWHPEQKKKFFQDMGSLPIRELEKNLFAYLPRASIQERVRSVTPNLHEVKVYLTSEEMVSLEEIRGWYAHSLKNPGSNSEVFRKLLEIGREEFHRRNRIVEKARRDASPLVGAGEVRGTETEARECVGKTGEISSAASVGMPLDTDLEAPITTGEPNGHLSASVRREVFSRSDLSCEYVTSKGRRCGSRHFLQIEHIKPRGMGGTHEITNLQVLCRDHNLIRGIRVYGPDKMRRS